MRGSNVKRGRIEWEEEQTQHWPSVTADLRRYLLEVGDVVIAMDGSLVGRSFGTVRESDLPALLLQRVARVRSAQIDSGYLRSWLCSERFTQHCDSVKTTTAIPHISPADIRSFKIAVPPLRAEQQAIGNALGDTDTLIDSLEQLLTKQRQIKQGAMQELLTGKRRVPGFGGSWRRSPLGSLLSIKHGRSQKSVQSDDGEYPILASGGVIGWASEFLHDQPSVLIGRKGTIDVPRYMDTPFWSVDTLFYSHVAAPNSAKFLYYRFCLIDWMQYNEASGVPSLSARVIESIEIDHPDPAEQHAIAQVLTDMDASLTALQARLTKARQLKQALMQVLLTGRIRLLPPGAAAVGASPA